MTSTDERLERYLHDRSATIDLPHAGVDAISRRARRHRRRRTALGGGLAAALLLGGAAVALRQPAVDEQVGSLGATVEDSPLEWTVVPTRAGLGGGSSAVTDGGAVYSLSTAAGSESEGSGGEPRRLYRSEDGTDWEDVGLPEGLFASSVSAADGSVYAVGTSAAGGEVAEVELAVSSDGGSGWDTSTVPVDLAALGDGFPGEVRAIDAEVASAGGTTVVAVTVRGIVDVETVLPGETEDTWGQSDGGMIPYASANACAADPEGGETTTMPPSTTAPSDPPAADASGRAEDCQETEAQPSTRTWADLGLTPEQAALADGETHIVATDPEGGYEHVETVARSSSADALRSSLLATADGWWLLEDQISARDEDGHDTSTDIVAWHSPDGRTWTPETIATDAATMASGVVGGRAVVVGITQGTGEQRISVHRVDGPGAVTEVDLTELLDLPVAVGVSAAGVGPAGVAVVIGEGPDTSAHEVVHSADGLTWGRQSLPEPDDGTWDAVNGVTITPDAIKVRLNVRAEGDVVGLDPVQAQRLFVGTPAG